MGLSTISRIVLVLSVAISGLYGMWHVSQYIETLTTLNRVGHTLERLARQENGDLRSDRRQLTALLTQAQTTTSGRTASLNEALAQLHMSQALRHDLEAQVRLPTAERLGESVGHVIVRDTITVAARHESLTVQDDWLDASLRNGVFAYSFRAEYHYIQVSHIERSGMVRIVESAYIQSLRNPAVQKTVPVVSQFVVRVLPTRAILWNPTMQLGVQVPAPTPTLTLSLVSYGETRQGHDVLLSGPIVGITVARHPDFVLSPVAVNVGHWIPLLHDLYLMGSLVGRPGSWVLRAVVSTGL